MAASWLSALFGLGLELRRDWPRSPGLLTNEELAEVVLHEFGNRRNDI